MTQRSYLVIGANVGTAIAAWLADQQGTRWVTLADRDRSRAQEAANRFSHAFSADELDTEQRSGRKLCETVAQYDVVISAIPAQYSPKLARCAIETATGFCDLGGVTSATERIQKLAGDAKRANVAIVTDCGLMPGLGNVVADHLLTDMNGAKDVAITVRAAGIPLHPRGPFNYGHMFSLEGLEHLCRDMAPVLLDGSVKHVTPFSGYRHVQIPRLQELNPQFPHVESFITAGAGLAPWTFRDRGVRHFQEHTLRWPGFVEHMHGTEHLTELAPLMDPVDADHPDIMYLDVTVADNNGYGAESSYELLQHFDAETGLSAMARTTGFPTAILAQLLAHEQLPSGVWTPEQVLRTVGKTDEYLGWVHEALGMHA